MIITEVSLSLLVIYKVKFFNGILYLTMKKLPCLINRTLHLFCSPHREHINFTITLEMLFLNPIYLLFKFSLYVSLQETVQRTSTHDFTLFYRLNKLLNLFHNFSGFTPISIRHFKFILFK